MEIVDLPERRFAGISLRTSNDTVPETPNDSITGLWMRFGSEVSPKIQKDRSYMIFRGEGPMPQIVAETWGKVWDYFADAGAPYQRTLVGDLEAYPSDKEVILYIGVTE